MNSVGIDLHRKRSHIAALDETGAQLLSRRIVNDPQTFLELLGELDGECENRARGDLWLGVAGRRAPGRRL